MADEQVCEVREWETGTYAEAVVMSRCYSCGGDASKGISVGEMWFCVECMMDEEGEDVGEEDIYDEEDE